MTLPALAVQRPVATFMLLLSLLVLGVVAFPRLSIEFFPLVEPPVISVVVPFPGSHPLEGLRQVVLPLEGELAAISGVTRLSGSASTGQARLTVRFNWSQDMALKKMEVRDAVDRIHPDLPEGIGRILIQTFRDGPSDVMLRGRIAAERDLSRSYSLLEQHIVRPLERIKGVASVRLDGVYAQQVRIQIEPQALKRHSINPGPLLALLQDSNLDMDLGSLHDDLLEIDVRLAGQFQNLEQIRTLRIGRGDLLLRDVASVNRLDPPVEYGRHLDGEFALGIDVYKEPSANTVAAVDRLMDKIKAIRSDPELRGIHLLIWNDQGREIRQSLVGLRNAGLFGGLLAVVVLFLFLRRLSTTLIVAVAIPFSLLVTCGIMYLLGAELDVLAMLGLMVGVGMLVDNAVVVIENIHRLEGQGMPASKAATLGARQVSLAVIAATATTVIVWSWLFTLERSPMVIYLGAVALPLCLAVLSSLLISLTFIPMAAARFVPRQAVRPGFLLRRLVPVYRAVLGWTLRHRVLALAGLIILAGSAYIPYSLIEKTGDVSEQGRDVSIVFRVHDPSDLNTMEAHVNRVEAWLKNKKAKLGYESVYSFYNQHGYAVTRIFLPWERATEAFLRQTRERLQADLPIIPGVTLQVGDQDRFARRGDRRLVTVALRGEDAEYLRKVATGVEDLLHGVEGVKEIFGPTLQGEMEAHILVDSERARTLGLSPQQIADAVTFTFRGRRLRGTQNGMEMFFSLPDHLRPGLAALSRLEIPRPGASPVPLGSVARITMDRTEEEIRREQRKTTQNVTVEFDPSVTTKTGMSRIRARMKAFHLPEGYSWDWGHRGEDRDDALEIMMNGVTLSLCLVILLMAALFESILQPAAIVITLPLAFFGAFWALWLLGYKLEPVAFMGVIILIGMVVNNGIVMVDHVNRMRRQGRDRVEALIEGCGDRLRPILMTTITTICGLAPLAYSGFAVGGVPVESMAVTILGGLASSTLFTLVALPVWYTMVEDVFAVLFRSLPRPAGRAPRRPGGVLAAAASPRLSSGGFSHSPAATPGGT